MISALNNPNDHTWYPGKISRGDLSEGVKRSPLAIPAVGGDDCPYMSKEKFLKEMDRYQGGTVNDIVRHAVAVQKTNDDACDSAHRLALVGCCLAFSSVLLVSSPPLAIAAAVGGLGLAIHEKRVLDRADKAGEEAKAFALTADRWATRLYENQSQAQTAVAG
jgi:hypothetical protein